MKLVPDLAARTNPMSDLYYKVKDQGIIDAVCKACSTKMKVLDAVEAAGLPIVDDMSGHPSMTRYMDLGYEVLIF